MKKIIFQKNTHGSIINGYGIADDKDITATITNTFVGKEQIIVSGKKSWKLNSKKDVILPENIVIYLKNGDWIVDKKIVTPDENNIWQYSFIVPKYDAEGNEIDYIIEEEKIEDFFPTYEGYNIINTSIAPITVKLPDVEIIVKGENPPTTTFEVKLKGPHDAPMPDNSLENNTKTMTILGPGIIKGENITFTNTGKFIYVITQTDMGEDGWQYDTSTYYVEIEIIEENGKLVSELEIKKDNEVKDNIQFVNIYKQPGENEPIVEPDKPIQKPEESPEEKPNVGKVPTKEQTSNQKPNATISNPKTGYNIRFWFTSTIITGIILLILIFDNYKNNKKRRKPRIGH